MKVLIITERFAPDFAGGGEVLTLETAHRMRSRGCDVRVLTTGDPADTEYEGIAVKRLPVHRYRFGFCVDAAIEAARGVDLIHVFGFHACRPGLKAARKLSIPILSTLSALFGAEWRRMKPPVAGALWQQLERWFLLQPFDKLHLISVPSFNLATSMGADPARCIVIPIGVNHAEHKPRWPKDQTVLFAAKLDVRKGIFEFLEAASRLPHIRFEVVGWGPHEQSMRARASANVIFHYFQRGDKLHYHFDRASIFCMPSHVETFGLALVEAQASGCAIISSVPLPFAGISIPGNDADALTKAIEELWSDPVRVEQAGRENLVLAEQYDWNKYADRLLVEYGNLINFHESLRGTQPVEMLQ